MNTSISKKLAALAVALMMNSMIVGSLAYLFNLEVRPIAASMSQACAPGTARFGLA